MKPVPLVFLPGMMCDARLYAHQIDALSRKYPTQIGPVTNNDSFRDIAREVLEYAPSRFVLIGLSMGGIVAMEILAQAADRVCGAVLLDTSPFAEPEAGQAVRDQQIELVRSGYLEQLIVEQVIPMFDLEGDSGERIADTFLSMALDLGEEVFIRQSRALQDRPDQQETLKTVAVPTLILCGRNDRLCPPERHQLMHELIGGSEFKIIEGAGHLPTLERPEATTAIITQWLEEAGRK